MCKFRIAYFLVVASLIVLHMQKMFLAYKDPF